MKSPRRVIVLYGGVSGEHEVSVLSARSVTRALTEAGYEVRPVSIGRDGKWRSDGKLVAPPHSPLLGISPGEPGATPVAVGGHAVQTNGPLRLDEGTVVFPVLHGTLGEDGTIQGLLEVAEVPYVGSGVLGSALGMDKIAMKQMFRSVGLPTVDFLGTSRREVQADLSAVVARAEGWLRYPMFVKPANLGSSVGITKAQDRADLERALETAARYDRRIIVEQGVIARELEVSVLGNDEPETSAVGEIIPGREFYDYEAKYGDYGSRTCVPADVPAAIADQARAIALEAFQVLDLAGMARVDFLWVQPDGPLLLSEVNTIPGFTDISMFARLWQAQGMAFSELVTRLVRLAWERHADRQQSLLAAREEAPLLLASADELEP